LIDLEPAGTALVPTTKASHLVGSHRDNSTASLFQASVLMRQQHRGRQNSNRVGSSLAA
jgi:hypothetical protein